MRPLAANVRNGAHRVVRDVVLNIEVPLLHVRPAYLLRVSRRPGGPEQTRASNVCVARDVVLRRRQHRRRVAFKTRDRLVPIQMLEENAVSAANGPFPIAEGIPCKSKSRSRIEQMSLHATSRSSVLAASRKPVIKVS